MLLNNCLKPYPSVGGLVVGHKNAGLALCQGQYKGLATWGGAQVKHCVSLLHIQRLGWVCGGLVQEVGFQEPFFQGAVSRLAGKSTF